MEATIKITYHKQPSKVLYPGAREWVDTECVVIERINCQSPDAPEWLLKAVVNELDV